MSIWDFQEYTVSSSTACIPMSKTTVTEEVVAFSAVVTDTDEAVSFKVTEQMWHGGGGQDHNRRIKS